MISRLDLLADLQKLLVKLQDDLRARCVERPEVEAPLRVQYEAARAAKRTAEAYEAWREAQFTQAAVAWILSCVFIRFLEDNGLLGDIAYLSGPGPRLALARDQHTIYFRQHPTESDREYLYHVFRTVRGLPGLASLFHDTHNPVWRLGLSGDGAQLLLEFWQKLNAEAGQDLEHAPLAHDFSDPNLDTRFLGDLYQDLSEDAKKRFALLQTPIFIEEFILDRTLTPAIETFGYQNVRMIDPTCGSGHFALGGFHRLFALHQRNHPAVEVRALAQRALDQVFGVDLNPFAVAIARFRLLLAALHVCDIRRLADAPAFEVHIAAGDSLLHGNPPGQEFRRQDFLGGHDALEDTLKHFYETEDAELARRYLSQQYHAVVGNPPYIIVKDKALNEAYRQRFESCHRQYSLAVPFMEQFFALGMKGEDAQPAGYVGMITANSFMKREMGKKLIEQFIPRWNLTHVIDTAGAYIPGHGTPTVILFGTNRKPVPPTIRTVMGIKGEPATPDDPARGLVWTAILQQVDHPGTESDFVSVADTPRESFHKHPWSIGGGGASELKELLDESCASTLETLIEEIGFGGVTREDEVFWISEAAALRHGIPPKFIKCYVSGDEVRDWSLQEPVSAIWPYNEDSLSADKSPAVTSFLWPWRTQLSNRVAYGLTQIKRGLAWFEYSMFFRERFRVPMKLAYASVATHNHFILERGGNVFKDTAFLILPRAMATEKDLLGLLGLLNSSAGCFWMKQVFHCKGSTVDQHGARQRTAAFEDFYQHDGTKLKQFPVPMEKASTLPQNLERLAQELKAHSPAAVLAQLEISNLKLQMANSRAEFTRLRERMIALQEELDWECYRSYSLAENVNLSDTSPEFSQIQLQLGERAFEIVMARKMAAGELETAWFARHGSTPITELPAHWPAAYLQLVERRIALIESDRNLALIEQPEYKRRWNTEPWEQQQERALREWLLCRLEDSRHWPSVELTSCAHLADKVRSDVEFMEVATLYRSRPDFDLTELVVELVEGESVPFLPVLRYKESGLRKRAIWEQVWDLQRREDAIEAEVRGQGAAAGGEAQQQTEIKRRQKQEVGDIPVPPKYDTKDFVSTTCWRLRGKLDVPKERFITYPHCNRDADRTPVIGWAGWDHLQQAQAVAGYYERMRTNEGWTDDRLLPLLAGVLELLPWLLQWHNGLDPQYGMGLGDFFRSFAEEEARRMGKTLDEVRAWQPPAKPGRKKKGT